MPGGYRRRLLRSALRVLAAALRVLEAALLVLAASLLVLAASLLRSLGPLPARLRSARLLPRLLLAWGLLLPAVLLHASLLLSEPGRKLR